MAPSLTRTAALLLAVTASTDGFMAPLGARPARGLAASSETLLGSHRQHHQHQHPRPLGLGAQPTIRRHTSPGPSMGLPSAGGLMQRARASVSSLESLTPVQARLALMLIVALSGVNFVAIKTVTCLKPAEFMLLRWTLAAVALAPWLLTRRVWDGRFALAGVETGLWLTGAYTVQQVCLAGPHAVPAGVAAFFCSLSSVVCPFLEHFTGTKLDVRAWLAAALAVLGAAVLELGASGAHAASSTTLAMNLLCWSQPLFFGAYLFRSSKVMKRYPGEAITLTSVQVATLATASAAWTAATTPSLAAFGGVLKTLFASPAQLFGLFWIGVVLNAACHAVQTIIVGKLSSSETAIQFSAEPLWAAAAAALVLGEAFGWNMYVGGALAVGACAVRTAPNIFKRSEGEDAAIMLGGKPQKHALRKEVKTDHTQEERDQQEWQQAGRGRLWA